MKNKRGYLLAAALAVNILILLVSILIAIRSRLQKQIPSAPDKDSIGTRSPVEPQELVPLKLGSKRIALQFSTFLPQIQLTLISVIQGVALGILIERFVPVLADTGLSNIPFLIRGFGSLMILALVWYLYSAVFVTFLWPFSWWHSLPHFLLLAVEGFTCYCVSRPSGWTIGGAFMALIAAIIRFLNTQIIDPAAYEVKEAYHHDVKKEKQAALLFFVASLVFGALGAWQYLHPAPYLEWITGLGVLLSTLFFGLYSERQDYTWIHAYLEGSPWTLRRGLILEKENS